MKNDEKQCPAAFKDRWSSPGWLPEPNPFAAATRRANRCAGGPFLQEQCWWQCLLPRS